MDAGGDSRVSLRALLTSADYERLDPEDLPLRLDRTALVEGLSHLAESDPEVDVRYRAKKLLAALGAYGTRPDAGSAARLPPAALGTLAKSLEGRPPDVRVESLQAFGSAHGTRGADEMVQVLGHEADPVVLASGLAVLGSVGAPAHLGALRRFLTHESPRVVAGAVEAAGRLDAGAALPMVLPMLHSEDNRVRANVLIVLWQTNRNDVLAYLARMAAKYEESYRASALWCLSQLEGADIEEILTSMVGREESTELLGRELDLLARVAGPRSIPLLKRWTRERPSRHDLVRDAIAAIARRAGIDPGSIEDAGEGRAPGGAGAVSRPAPPVAGVAAGGGRWRWGIPLIALVAGGALALVVGRTPSPATGVEASSPRPAVVAVRTETPEVPVARPGVAIPVEGRIVATRGPLLMLSDRGQLYAIMYDGPDVVPRGSEGRRVETRARFEAWDTRHGIVHLRAQGAEAGR